MIVGDDRLELGVVVRLAETPGMRELQADHDVAVVAGRFLVRADHDLRATQRYRVWLFSVMVSCFGLARPSGRTAQASPPQISLAPLRPKRRQRRLVFSDGRPSRSQSQPSIGWMPGDGQLSCRRTPGAIPTANSGLRRRCRRTAYQAQGIVHNCESPATPSSEPALG